MNLRDIRLDFFRLVIFNTTVACLLLWADPWETGSSLEHTIDRWAAVTTQFFYKSKAPDALAVVLIDEDTLEKFGSDWPLSLYDVADIGRRIACSQAKAIFFDFTTISRKVEGKADLLAMAGAPQGGDDARMHCPSGKEQPIIPIYFANIPELGSHLQDDLKTFPPRFLIQTTTESNVYPSGPVEFMENPPGQDEITPAFGLLRRVCGPSAPQRPEWCPEPPIDEKAPIFLSWNGNPVRAQMDVADAPECKEEVSDTFIGKMVAGIELLIRPKRHRCLPFLTLHGTDLYSDYGYIKQHWTILPIY